MASPPSSPLLLLPYELQHRIVANIFDGAESILDQAEHPPRPAGTHHSILLTCSHFYETFTELYYQHLTLRITHLYPRISRWATGERLKWCKNIRRLSLGKWVQLHETTLCFCYPSQRASSCSGTKKTIFSHFPKLTDVIIAASGDDGLPLIWDLPCHLYVSPDDELSFVKLLKEFGGCTFERPMRIPKGIRCWERHEYLLDWNCPEKNDHSFYKNGKSRACRFKGVVDTDPSRYEYHDVIVSCEGGNELDRFR